MEQNENQQPEHPSPTNAENLIIGKDGIEALLKAAKWAKFIAIPIWCVTGLCGLFFLVVLVLFPDSKLISSAAVGLVTSALSGTMCWFIYDFSNRIKRGIQQKNESEVSRAFNSISRLFKIWAILTVIMISIVILLVLIYFMASIMFP